jgi:hypothetical protein
MFVREFCNPEEETCSASAHILSIVFFPAGDALERETTLAFGRANEAYRQEDYPGDRSDASKGYVPVTILFSISSRLLLL